MKNLIFVAIFIILVCSCATNVDHEIVTPPHTNDTIEVVDWSKYISGSLKILGDSLWKDGKGHSYFVEGTKIFVQNNHSYFLGELISKKLDIQGNILPVPFYCNYNPICCSTFFNGEFYAFENIQPSQKETEVIIQSVMNKISINSDKYTLTKNRYSSKKELYLKYAHLGISMDSLTSGYKYYQKEMEHKYGYEISIFSELASIDMDIPKKLLQNEISFKDSILYQPKIIFSIHLGVFKSILIESDEVLDNIVVKIIKGEELSSEENNLINSSDIYYVHSSEKGMVSEHNDYHLIKKIKIIDRNDIVPLYITLADYFNEGDIYFTHILHIPD